MKEYRVYLLDGDGKIASACWVEAPTLRKAIAEVSQNFGSTCEVWNGAERLAVVHPLQVESAYQVCYMHLRNEELDLQRSK